MGRMVERMDNKKPRRAAAHADVFIVRIKMRKNATWQGSVKYSGAAGEVHFRSTLELVKIVDQALNEKHPDGTDDRDNGTE